MMSKSLGRTPWLIGISVGVLILVPAIVKLLSYPAYPGSDDAFIHLTVARNFATGESWGINPGERVNLSSSPIFTLLLTLCDTLGLNSLEAGKVISLVASSAAILLLYLTLAAITDSSLLRLAGTLLGAFNIHLWRWNGVVMETSLALFSVYLVFYLYYVHCKRETYRLGPYFLTGLAIGLAMLVRFELAMLLGCLLLDLAINGAGKRLRQATILCTGFMVAGAPWYVFSFIYFGSLLPTTFYAKTSSLQLINGTVTRQIAVVVLSAYGIPLLVAGGALLLQPLRSNQIRRFYEVSLRPFVGVVLFPLVLFAFYYLKTGGLQSPSRYYLPALGAIPLICTIIAAGYQDRISYKRFAAVVAGVVVLSAGTTVVLNQLFIAPVLTSFKDNYWKSMRETSLFLARHADSNDVVLVEVDIGILAYYGEHSFEIADGGGLASPELQGLSVSEQIAVSRPKYVVESIGTAKGSLAKGMPILELVFYQPYRSHSTQQAGDEWQFCNVYRLATY
jgi:hypothetical protein